MSYLGWASKAAWYVSQLNQPPGRKINILEIGVDRGQTALPLIHNLIHHGLNFTWLGVDIRLDKNFNEQLSFIDGIDRLENAPYIQANSLDFFPKFIQQNPNWTGFDLIMLDGDHNYETVSQELSYLDDISHSYTMCIIDDYNGKHADRDTFYADKETHKRLNHKDLKRNAERQGVNNAVDDFLKDSKTWQLFNPFPDEEPVILLRENAPLVQDWDNNCLTFSFKPENI